MANSGTKPPPNQRGTRNDECGMTMRKQRRQVAATDRQIDESMYEMHGLTKKETRIVEGKHR